MESDRDIYIVSANLPHIIENGTEKNLWLIRIGGISAWIKMK